MGKPRILRNNDRVEGATATASTTASGSNVVNVQDWKEYTVWTGGNANSHWVKIDAGSAVTFNSLFVAGHNLNTQGVTRISLNASSDNFAASDDEIVADFAPPNGDDAFAKFFTQVSYRYVKLDIDNNGGAAYDPSIGIWYVGNYIEMPYVSETPFDPDELEDDLNQVVGGTGYLLGTTLNHTTRRCTYTTRYATQAFVTNTWKPFLNSYRNSNFGWVWDYENNASEAYLMRFADNRHTMPYQGLYRQLSFSMAGRKV